MKRFYSVAAVALCLLGYTAAAQAQDSDDGKKVFRKCAACHKIGDGAKNGVGPALNNIFGGPAGSVDGYSYSKSLVAAKEAGLVWDETNLSGYLEDPAKFIQTFLNDPKARPKMALKLKDEEDRLDVIAYLQEFSASMEGEGHDDEAEPEKEGDK